MSKEKLYIELIKDAWLLPSNELATSPQEFEQKAKFFKKGTLFTSDWEEHEQEKPAPYYGWMYKKGSSFEFAHFFKYLLDNYSKYPELFREY
jgi:hypothetical protein